MPGLQNFMTASSFEANLSGVVLSVVWKGTLIEQLELAAAVHHNCECRYDAAGARIGTCSAHAMLAGDQRALNGLLWNRRARQWLIQQEGVPPP
jgi:hypothetical protein